MSIGSAKVVQIAVCVWDLEKAEKCYTSIFGIEPTRFTLSGFEDVPAYTRGAPDNRQKGVEILLYKLDDGLTLEVYGPCPKGTPWRTYLEEHGEGVMNLAFYVPDRHEAFREIGKTCRADRAYHTGYFPDCTYSFVDTARELGFELNIKQSVDTAELVDGMKKHPNDYDEMR